MKRPYRIAGFVQSGNIGVGGLSIKIGAAYATETAAIARVREYIAEGWDAPPNRYLIKKNAIESCWVTSEGEVVRRALGHPNAGIWGYVS